MKRLFNIALTASIFVGLIGCNPNEDIYDQLPDYDSSRLANMNKIPPVSSYTLTETDYELSSNESVANYHNFSEYAPAADYLPEIINTLFLADAGSEMEVTYDFYNPLYVGDTLAQYELDTSDYGNDYHNFDNLTSVANFAASNYTGERGDLVYLTYRYYLGGGVTDTLTSPVININNEDWEVGYQLTSADYSAMGQSYPNFDDEDAAKHRISIYLETLNTTLFEFQYAEVGTDVFIVYDFYDDGIEGRIMHLQLEPDGWTVIGSITQKTSSLTANGTSWSIVPPITFIETDKDHNREYTLTESDYEMVGNGNYYNFDVRPGANEESLEVRIEKISTILKANFSDIEIGDVFLVHYDIYNGAAETWDIKLEAVEQE